MKHDTTAHLLQRLQARPRHRMLPGRGATGAPIHFGWKEIGAATLEENLAASYKTKFFPQGRAISLLGIYLKELKTYVRTKTCTQMLEEFVHDCQALKQSRRPLGGKRTKNLVQIWNIISAKNKWTVKPSKDMEEA